MKIPFNPSVYEHAAALIKRTPWDTSRDPELLFEGHRTAFELYRHEPIVLGIDIYNLEAEAYGAVVNQPSGEGIPAIHTPLVNSLDEGRKLSVYDPATAGRIPMLLAVGRRLAKELPDADVRIPVSGPFSIAMNVRGITGLLEDVAFYPEETSRWLMQLAENQTAFCKAIIASGLDVAFFESAATPPMLSPHLFHEVELGPLKRIMDIAAEVSGHPVPCVIGGDTTPILDDMLATGTGYVICPAETDQEAFLKKSVGKPDVVVRVNLESETVARGSEEEILRGVDRVLELSEIRPNCLLGTGALPFETPPENIKLIRDYIS